MEGGDATAQAVQLEPVQASGRTTRTSTPKSGKSDSRVGSGLADFQDGQGSLDVSPFGNASTGKSENLENSPFLPLSRLTPSFSAKSPLSPLGRFRKERKADENEIISLSANSAPNPRTSSQAMDIPRPLSFFVSPIRRPGKRQMTTGRVRNPVFDVTSPAEVFESSASDWKKTKRDLNFNTLFVRGEDGNLSKDPKVSNTRNSYMENRAKWSPADIFWVGDSGAKRGKTVVCESPAGSGAKCVIPDAHASSQTDPNDVRTPSFAPAEENDAVFSSPQWLMTSAGVDELSRFPGEHYYLLNHERPGDDVYDDDNDDDGDDVCAVMRSASLSDVIFAEEEGVERNSICIGFCDEDFEVFAGKRDGKKWQILGEEGEEERGQGEGDRGEGDRGEGDRGEGDGEDQCEFCGQWFKDGSSLLLHYASGDATCCSCSHLDSLGSLSSRHQTNRKTQKNGEGKGEDIKAVNNRSSAWNEKADQTAARQEDGIMDIPELRGGLPSYIIVQDELGNIRLPFSLPLSQKIRQLLSSANDEDLEAVLCNPVEGNGREATCPPREGETGLPDEGIDESLFDVFTSADTRLQSGTKPQPQSQPRRRHRWKSDGYVNPRRVNISASFSQSGATDESWYSFLDEDSMQDGKCEVVQNLKPRLAQLGAKSTSFSNIGHDDLRSSCTSAVPLRRSVSVQAFDDASWEEWTELQDGEGEESSANHKLVENPSLGVTTENRRERRNLSQTSITSRSALPKLRPLSPRDREKWVGPDGSANQNGEPTVGGARRLAMVTPLKVLPPETEEEASIHVQEEMGRIIRDLERNGRRSCMTSLARRNVRRERSAGILDSVSEDVRDDVIDELIAAIDVTNGSRGSSNDSRRSDGNGGYLPCSERSRGADNPVLWRSRVGEIAKGDNYCCIFCRREFVSPQEFIGHFTVGRSDSCSHSLSDFLHLLQVPSLRRPDWWNCQCVVL